MTVPIVPGPPRQPPPVALPAPPPTPPRRRWPLLAALAAVAVLLVAGGTAGALYLTRSRPSASAPTDQTLIVTGDLILTPSDLSGALAIHQGQPCADRGGYADIQGGVSVVVYGPADEAVALGQLSEGFGNVGDFDSPTCRFTFAIRDVPAGLKFYSVEVSHRGKLHYSEEQLGQALHLTLGG